jgi:hypothetical protein
MAMLATCAKVTAQETKTFEQQAKEIATNIKTITKEEKDALKKEVEAIDKAVENGSMTKEEAEKTKAKIAEERANNIETKVAAEEEKLRELVNGNLTFETKNDTVTTQNVFSIKKAKLVNKGEKRTTSQFVFATGFNNLVTNGAIANSDFGYLRSTFVSMLLALSSAIFAFVFSASSFVIEPFSTALSMASTSFFKASFSSFVIVLMLVAISFACCSKVLVSWAVTFAQVASIAILM